MPDAASFPLNFTGSATPLGPDDVAHAAAAIGCEAAAVRAVLVVETGGLGGFLTDGSKRPRIRFESHLFGSATGHRWNGTHPTISTTWPDRGRSLPNGGEYARLAEAMRLDRDAAIGATSWGLFQILARNHLCCGYGEQGAFVAAMCRSESGHLDAFVGFVRANGLAPALRARDWAGFARRYNGSAYRAGGYDTRLAHAYAGANGTAEALNAAELARLAR